MNTYIVPISETYGYYMKYFIPIFAKTPEDAYIKVKDFSKHILINIFFFKKTFTQKNKKKLKYYIL